jgi:hypothetical protein
VYILFIYYYYYYCFFYFSEHARSLRAAAIICEAVDTAAAISSVYTTRPAASGDRQIIG